MSDFQLKTKFKGYRSKTDKTNIPEGKDEIHLVEGSQNVISTDGERVALRKGYTLDGQANSALTPIRSSFEWDTHRGVQIALRRYDDELEIRYLNSDGDPVWARLKDGLSTTAITQFTTVWDDTEKQDLMLFVDGDSNIYDWSGGIAILASATSNTVTLDTTLTGFSTWAEAGFLTAGTRTIIINGVSATYTNGEGTATLTGVSVDFSAIAAGTLVLQAVRTNSNKPDSNLKNNLIATLDNHVYVGQTTSRVVYMSANDDFKDFTFSSPRLPGEGALFTLDGTLAALIPQEDAMYMGAGKDQWYRTELTLSSDLTKEAINVRRLKTTGQKAPRSQGYTSNDGNRVIFVSNEPTFDQLGRVENIDTPQNKPLSDPIKTDFDSYDFSVDGHTIRYKNNQYIAIPAESLVLIYNFEKAYWESPQILPVRRFAVINGELYGHSSEVPETYKLFTGTNDNTNPIDAHAVFSYQSYGEREKKKTFDEWYTEGYIAANTILKLTKRYDYEGFTTDKEFDIDGSDGTIIFGSSNQGSLGKNSLGKKSLGGRGETVDEDLPPKFRVIKETDPVDFYEEQTEYSTNGIDLQWEILVTGGNVKISTNSNNEIKQ